MSTSENHFVPFPDPTDWDALIRHCDQLEELTDFEKEKAKRAFLFFKKEFGESFLKKAYNNGHPFMLLVANFASWTRKELILLSDSLKDLKGQSNYNELLNKLKKTESFSQANSEMYIAHKALKGGFNIHLYPQVSINGKQKSPDLKFTNTQTGEVLYCEITILGKSKNEDKTDVISRKIWDALIGTIPIMNVCGKIYNLPSYKNADDIIEKIKATVHKAQNENSFQELEIEDILSVAIAPDNDKVLLEKWASERGIEVGTFLGPPYNVNQLYRLKRDIFEKQSQLPPDHPNIVVIYSNDFFFTTRDIKEAIVELEESLQEFDHILSTIIIGKHLGGSPTEKVISKGQHQYLKKTISGFLVEERLILWNKFCNKLLSQATISKVYETFKP